MCFLENLNETQRSSVEYCDGPQLVIAGAGSGKTRVLTYKIAYLLQNPEFGLRPWNIMALTFTNKAANEMKQRIGMLVGSECAKALCMGTFHSVFAHILRLEANKLGFTSNFTIYDDADSRSLIATIVKGLGLSEKTYKASTILNRISMAKNRLITAKDYAASHSLVSQDAKANMGEIHRIYMHYEQRCKASNAMDFDDLLTNTWCLFKRFPDVCSLYAERYKYILVDEYQDTNYVQQSIVYLLAAKHQHVCVVGDDAQSIYGFRGAEIDNILRFDKQYDHVRVFKLEQNYRSTQNIVQAANSLIAHNQRQIHKNVYSENPTGDKLHLYEAYSDRLEAKYVCETIRRLKKEQTVEAYNHFAILYRTNAQSRLFEDELRMNSIPYKIYGGLSFYQRKEIKDILAYFRVIVNFDDEEALKRVINYPMRGIGATTLQKISLAASQNGVSLWTIINNIEQYQLAVNKGTKAKLCSFALMISSLHNRLDTLNAVDMSKAIIHETGVYENLKNDTTPEGLARQENMEELFNQIQSFIDEKMESNEQDGSFLPNFLQEVSLMSDIEETHDDENQEKVSLMTIHSAKGLEFPIVFIVGLEENIFPSIRSCDSLRLLEEERRLLYVAITRAEKQCYLSCAKMRYRFGKMEYDTPSRFIKDIDRRYISCEADNMDDFTYGDNWNLQKNMQAMSIKMWQAKEKAIDKDPKYWGNKSVENVKATEERQQKTILSKHPGMSASAKHLKPLGLWANTHGTGNGLDAMSTSSNPQKNVCGLEPGKEIEHQRFGKGIVLKIEGSGDNTKATVKFEEQIGTKQLLLKFAHFKIIQ